MMEEILKGVPVLCKDPAQQHHPDSQCYKPLCGPLPLPLKIIEYVRLAVMSQRDL